LKRLKGCYNNVLVIGRCRSVGENPDALIVAIQSRISRSLFSLAKSLELARNALQVILLGAALCVSGFGQSVGNTPAIASSPVTLSWDKSPSRDVKGYRLHYATTSKRYSETIDVGNVTTYTISNLIPKKRYYFVVTAYDATGSESLPSNERPFYVTGSLKKRK
jgi:hypothetical protein